MSQGIREILVVLIMFVIGLLLVAIRIDNMTNPFYIGTVVVLALVAIALILTKKKDDN